MTVKLLPKFANPPVVETVLGVMFRPMPGWNVSHFGLYWSRIRSHYQQCTVQPALADEIEQFGDTRRQINLSIIPANVRCWFSNERGDWLVQVQNSRFISNWRKTSSGPYPNYKGFRERFDKEWTRFVDFLKNESLGRPELLQAEISYINHIDVGKDFSELDEIFPVWARIKKGAVLDRPDAVSISAVFPLPDERGRLYIAAEPVFRISDMHPAVQLRLTANVLIASNSDTDIYEAFRLGHEWVVSGFADFTTQKMHEVWQRKQ